jgi:alpha-L-fucosidase 2
MTLTRREALATGAAAGALLAAPATAAETESPSRWTLWYRQPAETWVEALPVGNGRLGAMVYGGTAVERLQLNEESFWAGGPYDPSRAEALAALPEVRRLIWEKRWADAQALVQAQMMAKPIRQMSYQTLGELLIESGAGPVEAYRRWLDLDSAEAVTEWRSGGRSWRRTVFASPADPVIVVEIEGSGPISLRFSRPGSAVREGTLWLTGRNKAQNGVEGALDFAAAVRPIGSVTATAEGESLRLTASGRLTLLVAARTSYRDWQHTDADAAGLVRADLAAASRFSIGERRARHRAEHRRLFRGFDIDLGPDPFPGTPTDTRIRYSHEQRHDDPFLAALYVQYARYLLLGCSRADGQPANLQGLWNDSDNPPWGCKYTININTEMNYWPAEPLALGDCVEPLLRMVEELAVSGARTARVNYGARGWVCHHNTDAWRASGPIDGAFYGLWPTGGAWLCKHLWDRWDYGRDPALLRRIYPLMAGAGLFFLDTLVEHPDGSGLVTAPSMSPEHGHHDGVSICAGPAMDRQILRELFANIIEAARLLGRDAGLARQFASAAARLPADRIGKAGQLQEWLEDWDLDAPDIHHRHVSHLYALHPGHAIGPETPDLYKAARRALDIRGDDATGWGLAWRLNLWARLGEGEHAYGVLRKLLGPERTYPNLFDAHPPFQIDGNFGGAAGIVEMLVRDQPGRLELLPALPKAWPSGRLTGLRLRGGAELDLEWTDGELDQALFRPRLASERTLVHRGDRRLLKLEAGKPFRLAPPEPRQLPTGT